MMVDWSFVDVERARSLLSTCHLNEEHMNELEKFIHYVELIKRQQVKQVAKLLEKPNGL